MHKQNIEKSILFLISFLIASSWTFSNVVVFDVQLNHALSIVSALLSVFLIKVKHVIIMLGIGFAIFISTIVNAVNQEYFVTYVYKMLTFTPLVIVSSLMPVFDIYRSVKYSFIFSVIVSVGFYLLTPPAPKFIIYHGVIPRYAGLSIEPASFALAGLVVYLLYLMTSTKVTTRDSLLSYVPSIVSVSSVILINVLVNVLLRAKNNVRLLFYLIMSFVVVMILFKYTRVDASVSARLTQYINNLSQYEWVFFGSGFYLNESAKSLPGLFRIPMELGVIFSVLMLLLILKTVICEKIYRAPYLLVGISLPLITEAYGGALLWMFLGIAVLNKDMEFVTRKRRLI